MAQDGQIVRERGDPNAPDVVYEGLEAAERRWRRF